jgi:hypothetical protein
VTAKLAFALQQYAMLGILVVSAYGLGRPLTHWLPKSPGLPLEFTVPLRLAGGMAVFMVSFFIAASFHKFTAPVIAVLIALGLFIAIVPFLLTLQKQGVSGSRPAHSGRLATEAWLWMSIVTAVSLPLMLKPLRPPQYFDELMYHLPYARIWAEQGALVVNEWLRFPVFTYNMELIYGAALVFGSDVLAHLLHALAAALTALLTFGIARRYFDWRVACAGVIMLLLATRWGWSTANVDFGVMLFWTSAFVALALGREFGGRRFIYLSVFFAGMAVGIKYQAMLYLPVFLALVPVVERRPGVLARAAMLFAVFGGYWYLRNFLISGNPVHPLGQEWLGYWLWNAGDVELLFGDLERIRDWPNWYLLLFAGAALYWRDSTRVQRTLLLTAVAVVGIWSLISAYPRYLTAAYPIMSILSAFFIIETVRRTGFSKRFTALLPKPGSRARLILLSLFFLLVAFAGFLDAFNTWKQVFPGSKGRADFLAQQFGGYELLNSFAEQRSGTIYQLGFEGEIYYLGKDIRGEWFGPGRYRDVLALSNDASGLSRHLADIGADGLLVNRARAPFSGLALTPAFLEYFELLGQTDRAAFYWRIGPGQMVSDETVE